MLEVRSHMFIHRFALIKGYLLIFAEWIETQAKVLEEEGLLADGADGYVNQAAAVAHAQEKFMDFQGIRPNGTVLSMPARENTVSSNWG